MKLCFSTLGCPDWGISDIFSVASDLGYKGIEIRGIADEIYAPRISAFSEENAPALSSRLREAGIEIPILTSGAYLINNRDNERCDTEVREYAALAGRLGVKYVRVMGEKSPGPAADSIDCDGAAERFASLCDMAKAFGVTLLIETNGCFADTARLRDFMKKTARGNAGVVWDIHHPFRFFGEAPEVSYNNIGEYVRHVHVKDSVIENGEVTYMLTGYGDIPIAGCMSILSGSGYDGYVSYEWVKRWSRSLAEPGIAFYQYIEYMKQLLGE